MSNTIRAAISEITRGWTDRVGEIANAASRSFTSTQAASSDSAAPSPSQFVSDTHAVSSIFGYVFITAIVLILASIIGTVVF